MELDVFVHNIAFITGAVLSFVLAIAIFVRGVSKVPNALFALTSLTFVGYIIAYVLGVNTVDPVASQFYLSFTSVIILTVCFNAHLAFSMFNKVKEHKRGLQVMYTTGIALMIFFALDISRYVEVSSSYQYLPNYFVPGTYYLLFALYFFFVVIYFFAAVYRLFKNAEPIEKNRMKYFLAAFGWAYGISMLIFLAIYGIFESNPLAISLMGLYAIPLAYGIFKYDIIDIHVATKNALLYTFYSSFVGAVIVLVNIFSNFLTLRYENFPVWILPLFSGVLVVLVSIFVWRQIREADLLKYEFINNISHKFRTPLTHIRWLAEDLREMTDAEERKKAVQQIQFASMRLFELTNIVIDASQTNNDLYLYHFSSIDVSDIFKEISSSHSDQIEHKLLKVHVDVGPNVVKVKADKTRLQFALQIMYENALIYTPEGGTIEVKIRQIGGEVIISVKDSGIGITPEDLPHVFSKFYRSQNARHTDTEGMGIGLFMAKNIIEKHNGRIWAESYGENKGSTFSIALPIE
ncbi:MAG: HAMP domain-containing histidine kinase [Candidatus Pacebacteria bacterium]|nr:HAMP domain-containing histidine kinase [Candidatus Paceibacterota bacterium]MBP9818758.1 HAMP domain-containing histidine kinase [Candidatus Paceibacterota bacterium]